jgi:hypothetical protein
VSILASVSKGLYQYVVTNINGQNIQSGSEISKDNWRVSNMAYNIENSLYKYESGNASVTNYSHSKVFHQLWLQKYVW